MDPRSRQIIVYRPWQVRIALIGLVILLAVAGWWIYQYGYQRGGESWQALSAERTALRQQIDVLSQEREGLQARMAIAERSSQIDSQASQEVKQYLANLQDKLLTMREELEFYRGIVSPGDVEPGLRIQRFRMEPADQAGQFAYDLMLTQVKRNDRLIEGVIHLNIEGTQDGTERTLPLIQITQPEIKWLTFRFRYFQHFEGKIQLPVNFSPESVEVRVLPKGKRAPSPLEQTFEWPV
jgi:hypothetical protein